MPIIKPTAAAASAAVVLDLGDLAAQANRVLAEARAEAAKVTQRAVEAAQESIEAARKKAGQDGYAAGLERGREEGRDEARQETLAEWTPRVDALLSGWAAALEDIETRREQILRESGDDVAMLAVALGRKVAHRIVDTDPAAVVDQVDSALQLLRRPADVQVQVHPDDRGLLEEVLPELVRRFSRCQHLHLRDEADVGRGGCVVVTEAGRIDAGIDTQLDRIAETLVPTRIVRRDPS